MDLVPLTRDSNQVQMQALLRQWLNHSTADKIARQARLNCTFIPRLPSFMLATIDKVRRTQYDEGLIKSIEKHIDQYFTMLRTANVVRLEETLQERLQKENALIDVQIKRSNII
jgi:hypothetical protein